MIIVYAYWFLLWVADNIKAILPLILIFFIIMMGINNVMESAFIEISLCNITTIVGAIYNIQAT